MRKALTSLFTRKKSNKSEQQQQPAHRQHLPRDACSTFITNMAFFSENGDDVTNCYHSNLGEDANQSKFTACSVGDSEEILEVNQKNVSHR